MLTWLCEKSRVNFPDFFLARGKLCPQGAARKAQVLTNDPSRSRLLYRSFLISFAENFHILPRKIVKLNCAALICGLKINICGRWLSPWDRLLSLIPRSSIRNGRKIEWKANVKTYARCGREAPKKLDPEWRNLGKGNCE